MSELAGQTTQQLFRSWRGGDAAAGQTMAQRFSDWYYAISASRLGDPACRAPHQRASERFAAGVEGVTEARQLAGWAHEIVIEELRKAGERANGGDFPNGLTRNRKPSELLGQAAARLSAQQVELLSVAYDRSKPLDQVKTLAESMGGYPLALLEARYALKRALKSGGSVPFSEMPEKANLDWAPLPLYEAGRMAQGNEERSFELWMLSDLSLCKDIAEFSAFALFMRSGGLRAQPAAPAPGPAPSNAPSTAPAPSTGGGGPSKNLMIGGAVVLVLVLIFAAAVLL